MVSVEVTAVDPITGAVGPAVVQVDGSTRAATTTSIRVKLDRYLDPSTASRQAICVQSDTTVIRSFQECTAGLLLRPLYDPLDRTVTYFLESDATRLAPDTFYRITVFEPDPENGDFGFRAFDGTPLEGIFALELTTALDDPARPTEGPPTDPGYCGADVNGSGALGRHEVGARDVLAGCAFSGCHQAIGKAVPPLGLDLSAPGGIEGTAVGRVAHHSQRGPAASTPDEASTSFGRSMPIIAAGNPGQSYLLYKILLDESFEANDPTLARGETDRLRTVIGGMPMPVAPGTLGVELLEDCSPVPLERKRLEAAKKLSRWIAAGAAADATCLGAASCAPTLECEVGGFPTTCGADNCDAAYTAADVEAGCPVAP